MGGDALRLGGGNHRSDSVRHRLQWFIHLRVHGLRKGDEHLAYSPHWAWHSFTFTPWLRPSLAALRYVVYFRFFG